ncbi:hypothetical protein [Asticcacaulis sp. 201]|uniref:AbiU2 domain-containing protein n=1 Tax=Asticcacaulis sp. 201 TaxID=3028787 RepID=UPI0029165EE0|nr:hypothetical protein [Asticcacaulis sp. 201]MDV6332350.1 hypothetical protein [Asticcacaulis sp. 201]
MTRPALHNLGYRIWNQSRLAKHVDAYLQVYEEIEDHDHRNAPIPSGLFAPIRVLRQTAYHSLIVHLDMIDSGQGVSLRKLIFEAQREGKIDSNVERALSDKLDAHSRVLKNIKHQRNSLVAHRSEKHTFREIRDKYPITTSELRALAETYYEIAAALCIAVPFYDIWKREDQRANTKTLLALLAAQGA